MNKTMVAILLKANVYPAIFVRGMGTTPVLRAVIGATKLERPSPSKIQLKPPPNEKGHFKYDRDWSDDTRYSKPIIPGKNFISMLIEPLSHAYEIYPIIFLAGVSIALVLVFSYSAFHKFEIWLDRSQKAAPWDWERCKDTYWKGSTVMVDPEKKFNRRLPMMEQLQDEMVEAAKLRGTR